MAECTNTENQQVSAAFPSSQDPKNTGLNIGDCGNIFNPNSMISAVQTFNALNSVVNKMFGIEARWFRAVPQQRSKDVIFQEYTLSCVEDTPICIKVMTDGGNFPDSKYQYDLMGLEYEVPTEVQIDKRYWEELAGFGTAPQKKDIVYLVMPNKLYQVESSYLKRGFMEQETTWVINLKKYQPESSRREGPDLKETINQYTVSESELFGEAISNDIEKLVDDKQMNPFNSTTKDFYKELDSQLVIIPYNLDIQGIIAAQSFYDLSTSDSQKAVSYKNSTDSFSNTEDRSVTAWFMPRTLTTKEYMVTSIIKTQALTYPANYVISISGAKRSGSLFQNGDTFVISRPGVLNFYAKVVDNTNGVNGEYSCKIDEAVEDYLYGLNTNWSSMKNYKMTVKAPINIIDGVNSTDYGYSVDVYSNQYVKIMFNTTEYIMPLSSKLIDNNWYGIVVNLGNSWGEYNVNIWGPYTSTSTQKLKKSFSQTAPLYSNYCDVSSYSVNKSDSYLTNIRVFKTTIEEEKQETELLSYFSKDGDQILIGDNCDPRFTAPFISRSR